MTDKDLEKNVENALDWEPSLDARDIGVSVAQSVVTLRGNVPSYAEKLSAERVALHVYGIKAVANDLVVHIPTARMRTDTQIAQAALRALEWSTVVPTEDLSLTATDGWLTLAGTYPGTSSGTPRFARSAISPASRGSPTISSSSRS